jgi:hypothetical protein
MIEAAVAEPHDRADWRLVEGVYRQFCRILNDRDSTYLPDTIPGFLAEALSRVSSCYPGGDVQLAHDAGRIFATVDQNHLPATESILRLYFDERLITPVPGTGGVRFTAYNPPVPQRRRPTPLEASIETIRRLRDLHELQILVRERTQCAGILGGSVGYGRYMNVCGGNWGKTHPPEDDPISLRYVPLHPGVGVAGNVRPQPGSDMDLVLVLRDYDELDSLAEGLSRMSGAVGKDIADVRRRITAFQGQGRDGHRMFSHKLPLWGEPTDPVLAPLGLTGQYILSLHIFSRADFEYLLLADLTVLPFDAEELRRHMWDFRPDPANNRADEQRSFAGSDLRLERSFDQVAQGYQAETAVFVIQQGRYHPGMYQNLILPQLDVRWDDFPDPLTRRVQAFRWKIVERLRGERGRSPHERLRLSMSHTRSEVFAPHVARAVDEGRII